MSYRGYPASLIAKLEKANSPYCSPETLRFFNAYCGELIHSSKDTVILVESIRDMGGYYSPAQDREYRVTQFKFEDNGSSVHISHLTDNLPSARQAVSAYRSLSR